MPKQHNLLYWLSTGLLAFGMAAQGVAQLLHTQGYVDILTHLGYPVYFLTLIGLWKLLGVAAILMPRVALLKEWAYAGFFFVMSGAAFSHLAAGDSVATLAPAAVLLGLLVASWYLRPQNRKIISTSTFNPSLS